MPSRPQPTSALCISVIRVPRPIVPTQPDEEVDRPLQILDGQVDEDLTGHRVLLRGGEIIQQAER